MDEKKLPDYATAESENPAYVLMWLINRYMDGTYSLTTLSYIASCVSNFVNYYEPFDNERGFIRRSENGRKTRGFDKDL